MSMFAIGVTIIGGLCILCLSVSMAVLLKVQELQNWCINIIEVVHDWLELSRHDPEVKAHEGTD